MCSHDVATQFESIRLVSTRPTDWRRFRCGIVALILVLSQSPFLNAHDLWIELNQAITRFEEPTVISFKLGNCDAGRSNFKVSGALPREALQVIVVGCDDSKKPISDSMFMSHMNPEHGFWQSNVDATQCGTHWIVQRLDQVVEHDGTKRGILFAKAPWIVSRTMDSLDDVDSLMKPVGFSQPFEIIVMSSLLPSIESNKPIVIKLLRNGSPMASQVVEFAMQHTASNDAAYKIETDANGIAEYVPSSAGICLITSRFVDDELVGNGYDATYFSTSVCLHVTRRDLTGNIVASTLPAMKHPLNPIFALDN